MSPRFPALIALLAAGGASASSVTNEVISHSIQATDASPRASLLTNWLNGNFDLSENLVLNTSLSLTYEGPTAAATRAEFGQSGSLVTLLGAGLDWMPTDSWTFGLTLTGSPQSTQYAGTPVQFVNSAGTLVNADALVRSQTWQVGAELSLAWDSAGVSDLEWSLDGALAYTHLDNEQSIAEVRRQTAGGFTNINVATLQQDCQARPRPECTALLDAITGTPVTQDFERLSAAVTAILFRDTDLTVGGDFYVYQQDPARIAFYGLASAGRGPGLPIAPLQFMIRPELVHRFGDLSVRLWGQAGEYVSGTGHGTAGIGTRVQYKFSRSFRMWLTAAGMRDVDETNATTRSLSLSLGAGYRW